MRKLPLGELEGAYARAFDFDRRASLHLTYHTYGGCARSPFCLTQA